MKRYTWEEYYDKFYDWAESTQVRNLSYLEDVGDADEVAEIIAELMCNKPSAADRLLEMANDARLQFKCDDLIDFSMDLDKYQVRKAMMQSAPRFTAQDIETLYCNFEEEDIVALCHKGHLSLPDALREDEDDDCEPWDNEPIQRKPKHSLWDTLLLFLGINMLLDLICGNHDDDPL